MKSKQTAVRGPTGGGRPPVTGFYWNGLADRNLICVCLSSVDYVVLYIDFFACKMSKLKQVLEQPIVLRSKILVFCSD